MRLRLCRLRLNRFNVGRLRFFGHPLGVSRGAFYTDFLRQLTRLTTRHDLHTFFHCAFIFAFNRDGGLLFFLLRGGFGGFLLLTTLFLTATLALGALFAALLLLLFALGARFVAQNVLAVITHFGVRLLTFVVATRLFTRFAVFARITTFTRWLLRGLSIAIAVATVIVIAVATIVIVAALARLR